MSELDQVLFTSNNLKPFTSIGFDNKDFKQLYLDYSPDGKKVKACLLYHYADIQGLVITKIIKHQYKTPLPASYFIRPKAMKKDF